MAMSKGTTNKDRVPKARSFARLAGQGPRCVQLVGCLAFARSIVSGPAAHRPYLRAGMPIKQTENGKEKATRHANSANGLASPDITLPDATPVLFRQRLCLENHVSNKTKNVRLPRDAQKMHLQASNAGIHVVRGFRQTSSMISATRHKIGRLSVQPRAVLPRFPAPCATTQSTDSLHQDGFHAIF